MLHVFMSPGPNPLTYLATAYSLKTNRTEDKPLSCKYPVKDGDVLWSGL